ncbi:hypothetical protein MBLNU230_g5041t1 [Neophaeotheca triangularis]
MAVLKHLLPLASLLPLSLAQQCPDYLEYADEYHAPFSSGRYNLSSQRPDPACRTFNSSGVEDAINRVEADISDPDLSRLFQNAYPSTLDTAIRWKGYADNGTDEELTFIITGDINAMWLRDSSNQMQSYLPLLNASDSPDSIASLFRGVINLQARYLLTSPYCNSFQPPVESGIPPDTNPAASDDQVYPPYNNQSVFECKYELDSIAAFLQVSYDYYTRTDDLDFFANSRTWTRAVEAVLTVATEMQTPTYNADGSVADSPYTFNRLTNRGTETLANTCGTLERRGDGCTPQLNGLGNPVNNGTGLIRSAFRPSDDSTIFQFLIPANMMFSRYLSATAPLASCLGNDDLAARMTALSQQVRSGIEHHGIVRREPHGQIYAYEVDGYGGANIMDDANIPSLLSAPLFGYLNRHDQTYQNTRALLLSANNPYYNRGPVLEAIGGPHQGPGMAWPMAAIVRSLTSDDDDEIAAQLQQLVGSTDGYGLIHESVNSFDVRDWTREWFSWANGLFGQMILDLHDRKPGLLSRSYQGE